MPKRVPIFTGGRPIAQRAKARGKEPADRQRRRALHTASPEWMAQAARVRARDLWTCQHCQRYGDQVDHIHDNAHEHVDDAQLQTLCRVCHSRKTRRTQNAKERARCPRPR